MGETFKRMNLVPCSRKHMTSSKYVSFILTQAFKPSTNDLKEYHKVLDANGDGAVSLQDLEALSVQYLCGEGVLANVGSSQVASKFT